jgi:hypothetical protein
MKKIVFYNNWHNGDVFLCKEFVREITNFFNVPTYYCHNMKKCFYKDINLTECDKFEGGYFDDNGTITIKDDVAYINTWYYSGSGKYFHTGCTLTTLYNYFKDVYSLLGLSISPNLEYYLPNIDNDNIKNNINHNIFEQHYGKKILICNNIPLSGQSSEHDWSYLINKIYSLNPNNLILVSNDGNYIKNKNVLCIQDLYLNKINYEVSNDLMEISYISTLCDVILGRSSGPFSCCYTAHNIGSSRKIINVTNQGIQGKFGFPESNIHIIDARWNDDRILNEIKNFL